MKYLPMCYECATNAALHKNLTSIKQNIKTDSKNALK